MAKIYNYNDDWKNEMLKCPKCGWEGPSNRALSSTTKI